MATLTASNQIEPDISAALLCPDKHQYSSQSESNAVNLVSVTSAAVTLVSMTAVLTFNKLEICKLQPDHSQLGDILRPTHRNFKRSTCEGSSIHLEVEQIELGRQDLF